MRQHPLSAALPMIGIIERNTPVPAEKLAGLRAAGLFSEADPVIDRTVSQDTLMRQFPDIKFIPVAAHGHVNWDDEYAGEWGAGIEEAFKYLEVSPM